MITPKEVYENSVKKGFWEGDRPFSETIALCHSELSEALEEARKGKKPTEIYFENGKPEGISVELADCVIRIWDYCGREGIDIEGVVKLKHNYNLSRPYKHGKRF